MVILRRIGPLALGLCLLQQLGAPGARSAEFSDEIDKDFPLRSRGQLQVTNMRGDIVVQGWPMDRIRVRARRESVADTAEEAKRNASAAGFRYVNANGAIELSAEYGQGLSLEERLRERSHPRTRMQMTIFAPAGLALKVWSVDGKVSIKGWGSSVDARTSSGPISVEGVRGESVSLLCPSCEVSARQLRASLRCMGGSGAITVSDVRGPQVYVESGTGRISLAAVEGEQLYVSGSGPLSGDLLRGRIEFHVRDAPVRFLRAAGFLSGRTESGDVSARMTEWSFVDKAVLETASGNVALTLPAAFSGEVDLYSASGRVDSAFLVHGANGVPVSAEPPARRIQGRIGNGGELLKVSSEKGTIRILKGG